MSIEQAEETELESRFSCIMQTGVQPETLEISNNLPATHNSRKSSRKSWNIYGKMKEKKINHSGDIRGSATGLSICQSNQLGDLLTTAWHWHSICRLRCQQFRMS